MNFDEKAKLWDLDELKIYRSKKIAEAIEKYLPESKKSAMEFGCGTAQISFELYSIFEKFTLIDASPEMIKVTIEKIKSKSYSNYTPLNLDIFQEQQVENAPFDALYSALTLHHIADIPKLISVFSNLQKNNSRLYIVDLYTEDGSFHSSNNEEFTGHFGFNPQYLVETASDFGYKELTTFELLKISKNFDNQIKEFPIFFQCYEKIV